MKATIDFDPGLYRRLKAEAALSGLTVKALVAEGARRVLADPPAARPDVPEPPAPWIGSLRAYAGNALGKHDLVAMRASIAAGRVRRAP